MKGFLKKIIHGVAALTTAVSFGAFKPSYEYEGESSSPVVSEEPVVKSRIDKHINGIRVHSIINTGLSPEEVAALGASLSRSLSSMEERISKFTDPKVVKRIMGIFYRGYGHNSVGDMGNFVISFENVSMFAASIILGTRKFEGQEASTRYINFSETGYYKTGNKEIDENSEKCFKIYEKVSETTKRKLIENGMTEKEAEPAAFDIAGGCLPTSARTSVFFSGSIRTLCERLHYLENIKGIREVTEVAELLRANLTEVIPNSVQPKGTETKENLVRDFNKDQKILGKTISASSTILKKINLKGWVKNKKLLDLSKKERISPMEHLGIIQAEGVMAFRDFRDLHRHRVFEVNEMIFSLKRFLGFDDFYCNKDLIGDDNLRDLKELEPNSSTIENSDDYNWLYGLPMMAKFPYVIRGSVAEFFSMFKTRSSNKVHPNVSNFLLRLVERIKIKFKILFPKPQKINYTKRAEGEKRNKAPLSNAGNPCGRKNKATIESSL